MQDVDPVSGGGARGRLQRVAAVSCASIMLSACTLVGPTIPVQPGPGGSSATLQTDRRACMAQTDAQVQPVANRPGSSTAQIQVLYNATYGSCMAARGNIVLAAVPAASQPGQVPAGMGSTGLNDPGSMAALRSLAPVIESFRQGCEGERIAVSVTEAVLSPTAEARTVVLTTPAGGNCFGQPGQNSYLVARTGSSWRTLLTAEPGSIQLSTRRHNGYADVGLHSLGLCVYDYRWDGNRYARVSARDCATTAPPTLSTLPRAIRRS